MSKGTVHAVFAVLTSLLLLTVFLAVKQFLVFQTVLWKNIFIDYWLLFILAVPISVYFSLLVDIDHKMSKVTWFNIFICLILIVLGVLLQEKGLLFFGVIILTLTVLCAKFVPHRGPTHTLQFVFVVPFIILLIKNLPYTLFLIPIAWWAGFTHLLLDKIPFKTKWKKQKK